MIKHNQVNPALLKTLLHNGQHNEICELLAEDVDTLPSYYKFIYDLAKAKLKSPPPALSKEVRRKQGDDGHVGINSNIDRVEFLLVFIGRFRSVTGYGKATRDFFNALFHHKPSGAKVVGVDSQNLNTIGDVNAIDTTALKNNSCITIKPIDSNQIVHVIFHETPQNLSRLRVSGKSTYSAWTIFEDITMIFDSLSNLSIPQRLYVASDWNRNILVDLGLAADSIVKVPHIAPLPSTHILDLLPVATKISYLAVMSNVERKNIRTLLSAFIYAKESYKIDISLTLKIPHSIKTNQITQKVLPFNYTSINDLPEYINVISAKLTDAEMLHLIEGSHCIINLESMKGFDLDSLLALSMGRQCISTPTGGNIEYQNKGNTYICDVTIPEYFNDFNYTNAEIYSAIVSRSPHVSEVSYQIKSVYNDLASGSPKNTAAKALVLRDQFSPKTIAHQFYKDLASRCHDYDLTSLLHAKVEISLDQHLCAPKKHICDDFTIKQINKLHTELKHLESFPSKDEWLADRRRFVGSITSLPPKQEDQLKLEGLRDIYKGERCFVIGNGPSLNKTNLAKLDKEFTFCANKFYLKLPDLKWIPNFYTCLDWTVTPDDSNNIQAFFDQNPDILKFIPTRFTYLFKEEGNMFYYHSKPAGYSLYEKFEPDLPKGVRGGGTVATAMIQIAAFMGFKHIYLIGTDVSYSIPKTVKQSGPDKFNTGVKLYLESTQDDDPNHFCSNYFGAGTKWHDPNVAEMKRGFRNTYLGAHLYGINVYNATVGGELDQVPRVDYSSLFS